MTGCGNQNDLDPLGSVDPATAVSMDGRNIDSATHEDACTVNGGAASETLPLGRTRRSGEIEPHIRIENNQTNGEGIEQGAASRTVVESSTAAQAKTLKMAIRRLNERRLYQYNRMQDAFREASKALETKEMIDHLETILVQSELEYQDEKELIRQRLTEHRKSLYTAVADDDSARVTDVHVAVESLMLSYDPMYLENVEARRLKFRQAVRDNIPPKSTPSWKQDPTYRFLCLLKGDFTGEKNLVTRKEVQFFLSRGAWALALLLMTIAIVFVSIQFAESRSSPAVSTAVNHYDNLELPVVWACLTKPMVPMFKNLPNQSYVGWQVWGLRSYTNIETGETYLYPQTEEVVSEPKILGPDEFCNDNMQYLSKQTIDKSVERLFEEAPRCYSCLRIGIKKPVVLEYTRAMNRPAGAVSLEFALLKDLDYCFTQDIPVHGFPRSTFKADLKRHGQLLVDKGAVILENNVGIDFALDFGFEAFDQLLDPYHKIEAEASVLCNLFFFSGVFYPVREKERARYRFDLGKGVEAWEPLGDPKNYVTPKVRSGLHQVESMNRTKMLTEFRLFNLDNIHVTRSSVRIYSVENTTTQPTSADLSGVLRENADDVMVYTKQVESEHGHFSTRLQRGTARVFQVPSRFQRFNISLDFAAFDVEVNHRVPTTTWAEFLTDVFEYVGLFTGICAYSLLVSPAKMYLRRVQKYERHRTTFTASTT